ncbi:HAD family hydrolase [Ralstonia sp. A12]|uniref:HAD family hydrolase n=1 Tax=Ralstonia sp. A12 TaxID=1217052 RepID=UPI0006939322|nr:HAD-IB family hydrolase [Ralstonia sp. A12]
MTAVISPVAPARAAPEVEAARICAVFDLDETLIRSKSMLAVLEQYHRSSACAPDQAERRIRDVRANLTWYVERNANRAAQNHYFYRQLAGIPVADMARAAQQWFEANRAALYHDTVVAQLKAHQQDGATVIVVSGSFAEAIAPIAADLSIEHVVCARLEQRDGRYTGAMLGEPTIGEGKAIALRQFLQAHDLSMRGGFAYGDHDSDIPLLSLADHPVAVGSNAVLLDHARRHDWRISPAVS